MCDNIRETGTQNTDQGCDKKDVRHADKDELIAVSGDPFCEPK